MSLSQGKAHGEFSPRAWERTWERTWEQTWEQQGHKSNKATKATRPQKCHFSRISRHFQGPRLWIFKDFTSFSRALALDFQGFLHRFSWISIDFHGFPWILTHWERTWEEDLGADLGTTRPQKQQSHKSNKATKATKPQKCHFSKISRHFQAPLPALDFQGFHVIFKGPGLGFSRVPRHFQRPRPWIFYLFYLFYLFCLFCVLYLFCLFCLFCIFFVFVCVFVNICQFLK